jgi:hypothetical protein
MTSGDQGLVANGLPDCDLGRLADFDGRLHVLAELWAASPHRPRPESSVVDHWDQLIADWAGDVSLPLFVRKKVRNVARGERVNHRSGRVLIPCDNSPANWSLMMAFKGWRPMIDDIRAKLPAIPVAMIQGPEERQRAPQGSVRVAQVGPNDLGWKVSHIEPVGLKTRVPIEELSRDQLSGHFRRLMTPSNMFLVPKAWSGLGELPQFADAVRRLRSPR